MSKLYDSLISFFVDDDWPFTKIEAGEAIQILYKGESGEWRCFAFVRPIDQQFIMYSVFPHQIPLDKRHNISEFISRANFGMMIGNFELDFDDGELRFKTGFDVENTDLTYDLLRPAVYTNVKTMDKYYTGLFNIIYNSANPKEEIIKIEGI